MVPDLGFRPENGDIVATVEPHGPRSLPYSTFASFSLKV